MKILSEPEKSSWDVVVKRPVFQQKALDDNVTKILTDVRENGDSALKKYSKLFDYAELQAFHATKSEISEAVEQIPVELRTAIKQAKSNIETFHAEQIEKPARIETMPGVACWRKSMAISPVGFYIPGGSAPLFSSVLMLGVPARIAGCSEIILCTPPDAMGRIQPAILFTANLLEIDKIFKIGGAHAIAAMAYGTESVPKVNKIFGPGNQYVTAAKKLINSEGIAIDLPAGPSELMVFADTTCNPRFVAADLLSQAEHGEDSQVVLVTTDEEVARDVNAELDRQIADLPRKNIARKSLDNGCIVVLRSKNEAMALVNMYAPEHLILACQDTESLADQVVNAGSVFLGHFTPESAGDYASGTNHVLPTNGYARNYTGVSVDSFVKKITFQGITEAGLKNLAETVQSMAKAEYLEAHSRAVGIRLENLNEDAS